MSIFAEHSTVLKLIRPVTHVACSCDINCLLQTTLSPACQLYRVIVRTERFVHGKRLLNEFHLSCGFNELHRDDVRSSGQFFLLSFLEHYGQFHNHDHKSRGLRRGRDPFVPVVNNETGLQRLLSFGLLYYYLGTGT